MKLELIEVGQGDINKEWAFTTTIESENGFENSFKGCSFEEYRDVIRPRRIKDSKGIDLPQGFVPQTVYLLYVDGNPAGQFNVRHYCNDFTRKNGVGHIGYAIAKEYRGQGLATLGLKMAIEKLLAMPDYDKSEGIIMGFHKNNIASRKVQEKAGAVIIDETDENYITQIKIN